MCMLEICNYKDNVSEGSERKRERWRDSFHLLRECVSNCVQNVGRNGH